MSIHILRISLRDTKPPIWRRVAVPSDTTLGQLHEIIQIAMGWLDSHLHQFMLKDKSLKHGFDVITRLVREERYDEIFTASQGIRVFVPTATPYGDSTEMEGEDENAFTLGEVCPKAKSKLTYEYDFGDGWEHMIEVEKIVTPEENTEYPVCLAGKLACPPEDCGGVYGYYEMLEAVADPKHEYYAELIETLGDDFDPEAFGVDEVNECLADWRNAQKKRAKSKLCKRGGNKK